MPDAYITDYLRTAFTRAHPFKPEVDAWRNTPSQVLVAHLIDALLARNGLAGDAIEDLSLGCALPVGEQWSFGGRYPAWLSQLGVACPSRQTDQQCGSGLAAIRSAVREIQGGAIDMAIAAGHENMTRVPIGPSLFEKGLLTILPALREQEAVEVDTALNMGLTAERLANQAGIERSAMDAFAVQSHQRAHAAQTRGWLAGERLILTSTDGETVSDDSCIRPDTSEDRLAELPPVFSEDGRISAGNSSPLTSGAAATLLMSARGIDASGLEPLARIVQIADVGVPPELMGSGAAEAARRVLARAELTPDAIDYWEINEAFSAVSLHAIDRLGLDAKRVNVNGGALALGHPLGATGVRLAGTLARILHDRGGRYGCASACIGGGQGIAMVIERV